MKNNYNTVKVFIGTVIIATLTLLAISFTYFPRKCTCKKEILKEVEKMIEEQNFNHLNRWHTQELYDIRRENEQNEEEQPILQGGENDFE